MLILVPKDIYVLISRTCEYATLHGKKDSAYMIKFRILRCEITSDYQVDLT